MSERFQKPFITAREFIESWDKELYELNRLDYFIYLMINHLGNQLHKRYFILDKRQSPLALDFENLGTLCFNLGDSLQYLLEENCFGSCSLNCPRDLYTTIEPESISEKECNLRKLHLIQTYLGSKIKKEQCLRMDILNHVILDTLISYYDDLLGLELDEKNVDLIELSEFIEDVMIEMIRNEGQDLLQHPFRTAMNNFEELLQEDTKDNQKGAWLDADQSWDSSNEEEEWQKPKILAQEVFEQFILANDRRQPESSPALLHDIDYLKRFILEYAGLEDFKDFKEHQLKEFMSTWLAKEFILGQETQLPHIFKATAKFLTFLNNRTEINLKREFLFYYEKVKVDLPRVVKAMNQYIADYDLLTAILVQPQETEPHFSGFFEIDEITSRSQKLMGVTDLQFSRKLRQVCLESDAFPLLKKGDILQSTLYPTEDGWMIADLQIIYPHLAKGILRNWQYNSP